MKTRAERHACLEQHRLTKVVVTEKPRLLHGSRQVGKEIECRVRHEAAQAWNGVQDLDGRVPTVLEDSQDSSANFVENVTRITQRSVMTGSDASGMRVPS